MSASAAAAAAAERKEPTRLSHREFAIWPLDPLTGAPWVLVPRSFLQPNSSSIQIITDLRANQKSSPYQNPCETPEEI